MKKAGKLAFGAFILILSVSSCKSTPSLLKDTIHDFKAADFIGVIYDSRNRPCQGVSVTVLDEKRSYRTDIDGRFVIPNLSQGQHEIQLSKEGFVSLNVPVNYTSRKQVLYAQMTSADFLLDECKKHLDNLEWDKAEELLLQCREINADNSRYLTLEGALFYRTERYEEALGNWMQLIEKGHKDAYLYLIIADTYQYGLEDNTQAALWLRRYLEKREDESARERLEEIS